MLMNKWDHLIPTGKWHYFFVLAYCLSPALCIFKFCLYEYYVFFSDWHTVVLNNFLLLLKDGGYSGKKGLLSGSRLQFLAHCFSSKRTNLGEEIWGPVPGERPRQSGEAVLRTLAACLVVYSKTSFWVQARIQARNQARRPIIWIKDWLQGVLTTGNYSVMLTLGIASSLTGPRPGVAVCVLTYQLDVLPDGHHTASQILESDWTPPPLFSVPHWFSYGIGFLIITIIANDF